MGCDGKSKGVVKRLSCRGDVPPLMVGVEIHGGSSRDT